MARRRGGRVKRVGRPRAARRRVLRRGQKGGILPALAGFMINRAIKKRRSR